MGDHVSKKPSWGYTLVTQAVLCLALYAVFRIGKPQTPEGIISSTNGRIRIRREPIDFYFLSVRGGFWPLKQQTHILQQMTKAVKIYNAKFVVNISELGDDDPLTQNATLHFPVLKIPWYTTTASHGHVTKNFLKNIRIPYEQVIDIIGVDTGPLQLNETDSDQLWWLQRTLAVRDSNWRIAIGFDPLIACEEGNAKEKVKFYEPLHNIFIKYGVTAYLSKNSCTGPQYLDGGIAFIGVSGPSDKEYISPSRNENPKVINELSNGFLLHRVSPLEIESYFINSAGKVDFRYVIHQQGREVM